MKQSRNQSIPYALAIVAATLLAGCAVSNEGAIDYRRAEAIPLTGRSSDPISPAPLLRKDLAGDDHAHIEKQDSISIRLREGFLRNCNERLPSPLRGFHKNCEIAILFKAFELTGGQDFNFKPGAEKDARLVYFSNDVQPNQFFNLHNMPVYGPLDYTGRPIGIDIWILEIDAEDKQAVAILRTLASIGAKAYAPSAPILGVLDQLGSALLSSGTDDVEFRFSMVLDPRGGNGGTLYSAAEAGDYIFIRQDDRSKPTDWHELQMDHNTGRVWKMKKDGKPELYQDNTYLTVQILKNAGSDDVSLAQNTYGDFRTALDNDATEKAANLEKALIPELEKLALKRVQIKNFNRAQKLYESIVARRQVAATKDLAKQDAFDLYQILKNSAAKLKSTDPKEQKQSDLSSDQIDTLLRKLRVLAKVSDKSDLDKFTQEGFPQMAFDAFVKLVVS